MSQFSYFIRRNIRDRNIRDSCEFRPNLIEGKFFIRQNLASKYFLNQWFFKCDLTKVLNGYYSISGWEAIIFTQSLASLEQEPTLEISTMIFIFWSNQINQSRWFLSFYSSKKGIVGLQLFAGKYPDVKHLFISFHGFRLSTFWHSVGILTIRIKDRKSFIAFILRFRFSYKWT